MKKFIILVMLLCTCVIFIDACSPKTLALVQENIAEVHYNIYAGASDEVSCTYSAGKREIDYKLNGYATELIDFGLITFVVNNPNVVADAPSFELSYGKVKTEGVLEQNPYDGSYVADIKQIITTPTEMIATIKLGSYVKNITLYAISPAWKITYNDALQIATKHANKTLKTLVSNNEFLGETHIKILTDTSGNGLDTYYWFVSFLGRQGTKVAVLIDTMTGAVLAIK